MYHVAFFRLLPSIHKRSKNLSGKIYLSGKKAPRHENRIGGKDDTHDNIQASHYQQAVHKIASNCLKQIQTNRLGIVKHRDHDSLHQMRIGLGRLDAVLELFVDFFLLPEDT